MLPDEISDDEWTRRRVLLAAEGYAELSMWHFAWEELQGLPLKDQARPEVREAALALLIKQERWLEAIDLGRELCRQCPDLPAAFIHTAFCQHELGRTMEALKTLRSGPNSLQQDGLYHYNCACYLAVLGYADEARDLLRAAFALDESLQENARTDPDLQILRGKGESESS
jgi:tetratricopeptide (TPR) repeat protein